MIRWAGAENGVTFEDFKPISTEAMIEISPDALIMMPERIAATGGKKAIFEIPRITATRAGNEQNILEIPVGKIMRLGLRTPSAIIEIQEHMNSIE